MDKPLRGVMAHAGGMSYHVEQIENNAAKQDWRGVLEHTRKLLSLSQKLMQRCQVMIELAEEDGPQ